MIDVAGADSSAEMAMLKRMGQVQSSIVGRRVPDPFIVAVHVGSAGMPCNVGSSMFGRSRCAGRFVSWRGRRRVDCLMRSRSVRWHRAARRDVTAADAARRGSAAFVPLLSHNRGAEDKRQEAENG